MKTVLKNKQYALLPSGLLYPIIKYSLEYMTYMVEDCKEREQFTYLNVLCILDFRGKSSIDITDFIKVFPINHNCNNSFNPKLEDEISKIDKNAIRLALGVFDSNKIVKNKTNQYIKFMNNEEDLDER